MNDLFLNYDQIASEYNQRYPSQRPTQRGLALLSLAQQVKAGNILEVGSGTGFWLNLLYQVSNGLYGLDYSVRMIEEARKQPASLKLTRGTAIHLPYRDHSFELVYCVDAIHHFADQHAFISEAFRVLKPGGALAMIGFDPHEETTKWYIYNYFDGVYENDTRRYPSEESVLNWMRTEGFENRSSQAAEHILNTYVDEAVLRDPFLKHNSTSQLALLNLDAYQIGIQNIKSAIEEAGKRNEKITFHSDIFIKMYSGHKPDQ
jgi:ubiquinone/menaquinone biosynthesis C-methylase UbiE